MKDIKEKLKERTQSTIDKIILRAEKIKEREILLARKKYDEIVSDGKKKTDDAIKAKRDSLEAQVRLECRLKEEKFKDELCRQLLSEAKEAVSNIDDMILLDAYKRLIREGVVNLGLREACVKVNKKASTLLKDNYQQVVNFIKEKVEGFSSFKIDDSLDSYGIIVGRYGGGEFFNNTFERRFERFEGEFMEIILRRVEGDDE